MGFTMSAFSSRIGARHVELSALREEAAVWLSQTLEESSDSTIADVSLVLTELAANVVDHTSSETVTVDLRVDDSSVTIEVSNDGPVSAVPPIGLWGEMAEGSRGRGLRLIRALCDDIAVTGDADRTCITCSYRVG